MIGDHTTLPMGWASASLGEVASFEMGQAPPGSASNFSGQGTVFVKAGEFGKDYPLVREWTTAPLKHARAGDVLICVVGATAGKLNLGFDCAIGRSVAAIRPTGAVLQKIIYRQLQARVASMRAGSTGSAQGVISKEMLAELPIAIPPRREQQHIADKLDTVLARVDACRDRLARVAPLLKRFRQSVLASACSGRLTEEWRGQRGIPDPTQKTLRDVIQVSSGRFLPAKDMTPGGFIPVFGGNGINGHHDDSNVEVETVVIGRVGFYCGSVHLTPARAWVTDNAMLVAHDPSSTLTRFLYFALQAVDLRRNNSSTAQPVISGQKIYPIPIALPHLREQTEIVRRVETLFAFADRLESRLAAAQSAVDRLTPALLAKAFRGELVPQDPADEPASELLRRLAQSRSALAPKTRKRQAA